MIMIMVVLSLGALCVVDFNSNMSLYCKLRLLRRMANSPGSSGIALEFDLFFLEDHDWLSHCIWLELCLKSTFV